MTKLLLITSPGFISTTIFRACGMTRISENIMAASSGYLSIGWRVTLHARSGVWHIVKKSVLARSSLNSSK